MNEILEIIYQWHQGAGFKAIRRSLGFDRNTVRKYVRMAQSVGVEKGRPLPDEGELSTRLKAVQDAEILYETPAQDLIDSHRDWVGSLLEKGVQGKQIWRLFQERTGLAIGYSTLKRYLSTQFQWGAPPVTVRLEVEPGSQGQVDFGYVGKMRDPSSGKIRKAWAFMMTLSYSRHRFVRLVFSQDIPTWTDCHIRAFEFFGGIPAAIVLDNLKSGVVKPDLYDPTLNRAYAELERHYGFVADPAKVASPKQKGKVERNVPVVRNHLLAGRDFRDLDEANERALRWSREEIGMEIHGTTKRRPYEVFQKEEAARLKPLPAEPYECPLWKSCKVHPDHHVVFDLSYYSLPTRFIGQEVWVRGGSKLVQIFQKEQLIKTHVRALVPGTWKTDSADYPPSKLAYLMATPTYCRKKAAEVGPQTEALIQEILGDHVMRNLRKAQAILRLAKKYGSASMEAAAQRALLFGNCNYKSIQTILEKGWETLKSPASDSQPVLPLSPLGQRFLRPPDYFVPGKEGRS
jgi:transposase